MKLCFNFIEILDFKASLEYKNLNDIEYLNLNSIEILNFKTSLNI